jgi:anti-anti-sigma regulatory factor
MIAAMATSAPSNANARGGSRQGGRVGSEEYHSATLPIAQEAAVLYAANHTDAAVAILKAEIKDTQGRNNKQAWLMLFDLYQVSRNRPEFDALSMLYTIKFEQSSPAWNDSADAANDPRRVQNRERKDYFALKPAPDGSLAAEIEKFVVFAESQGTVRLDVGKVTSITAPEATLLAVMLAKLRKQRLPMWFNNVEALERALRAAFNERATEDQRPYWLLLFELYVLQGKDEAFEALGLEYAVAFEISPPSWEVYVNTISAAAAGVAPAVPASPPPDAGYALKGVLSATSANQLAEMNGYAASRSEVVVDFGKVMRIDFAFTDTIFDAIKAIQLAGKRVILTNISELNAALLEALGVNRYAIMVRRKA